MKREDLVLTPQGIRFRNRIFPCSIGRSGVTSAKAEGDKATPIGVHRVTGLWYRADRLARPAGWARPIGPRDLWCDESDHAAYNHHCLAPLAASHEKMRRADPLYDVVLTTDWNWPDAVAGRGSAIFLHQWRRPGYGTEGCIAFARQDLLWILRHIGPGTKVIVPGPARLA
ncbi:L,D-transpeptidase family protein [Paracoccus sp. Z330]|uniref:L,D-transpeptidase family protein n=1 Tax=Paracoccus onchidii TaxID=3017813 RepID=A0ABT4ZII9_9RHOB|nr:L,D-transpeptidase family protein [Paracoccus onchidii]MDB6178907.1 L,D-transpeptidase family protein [Paracoccus onchidii]